MNDFEADIERKVIVLVICDFAELLLCTDHSGTSGREAVLGARFLRTCLRTLIIWPKPFRWGHYI